MAGQSSLPISKSNSSSSDHVTSNLKGDAIINATAAQTDEGRTPKLRDDPEARAAFLATFSQEEAKIIMRKVDVRFFVLIGLMFMVKNVCRANNHVELALDSN